MIKIYHFLLILFLGLSVRAQKGYVKLPQAKTKGVCYIINSHSIGNENMLRRGVTDIELKNKINDVTIIKEAGNRSNNSYYNFTEHGILFLDLKVIKATKSQSELNNFFGFSENNAIYVDGYLVENKELKICLAAIEEIEIVAPNIENSLEHSVLNIWTLKKKERYIGMAY